MNELGGTGGAVPCDLHDDAAVEAVFRRAAAETGRLEFLVNNAAKINDALIDPDAF